MTPSATGGRSRRSAAPKTRKPLVRARLPQAVQQGGHAFRVVEGNVDGGPIRGAGIRAQAARTIADKVGGGAGVAGCGGVLVQLGSIPVQAAGVGGVAE